MNNYEFLEGLDPSVLAEISGSQLLQLIRNAKPSSDRGLNLYSDDQPDVVTYPHLKTYTWYKPSEDNKIPRRYNESTVTWETQTVGNLSVDTDQIIDGAVTLDKLFNPNDVTKAGYLIRVNASGDGWELFEFTILDNSISLGKLYRGFANNNKVPKITADGAGWEYSSVDDLIDLLTDKAISLAKIDPAGVVGGIFITNSDGSLVTLLLPGVPGQILRTAATGPYWSNETVSPVTKAFTSANQTLNAGFNTISVDHGLGVIPTNVRVVMVCVTADGNYTVGDEVNLTSFWVNSGSYTYNLSVAADVSTVKIIIPSIAIQVWNKTLDSIVAIDRSKWAVKVYAHN